MRQKIYGLKDHPEFEILKKYSTQVLEGTYQVQLDFMAWGKSTNLFCFFTELQAGDCFRLSVFNRNLYKPYNEGPAFDKEQIGCLYQITTSLSKNGLPKFMSARKTD